MSKVDYDLTPKEWEALNAWLGHVLERVIVVEGAGSSMADKPELKSILAKCQAYTKNYSRVGAEHAGPVRRVLDVELEKLWAVRDAVADAVFEASKRAGTLRELEKAMRDSVVSVNGLALTQEEMRAVVMSAEQKTRRYEDALLAISDKD